VEHSHSEENVRDLLDRRERELLQQIELLQAELEALRNDLTPREVELIEVRRAKAALGMAADNAFPWSLTHHCEKQSGSSGADREITCRSLVATMRATPPHSLKIKELLVLAFIEHFQVTGAAPADLKAQIQASYKREIDPGSIRPNLARLREDGIVMRSIAPKWVLQPEAAQILTQIYFENDLLKAAAALAWREDVQPSSSRELLKTLMQKAGVDKT
jgi:hypothetical protein